jgi:hypothetical protein
VALLQRRVESTGNERTQQKSREAISTLAQEFIVPYFEHLAKGIGKVSHLFNEVQHVVLWTPLNGKRTTANGFPQLLDSFDWLGFNGHWQLIGYKPRPAKKLIVAFEGTAGAHEFVLESTGVGARRSDLIRIPYSNHYDSEEAVQLADERLQLLIDAIEELQDEAEGI